MNAEEIKDLIASKIAGQGNQVDIGNALPEILTALVEEIAKGAELSSIAVVTLPEPEEGYIALSADLLNAAEKALFLKVGDRLYPRLSVGSIGQTAITSIWETIFLDDQPSDATLNGLFGYVTFDRNGVYSADAFVLYAADGPMQTHPQRGAYSFSI